MEGLATQLSPATKSRSVLELIGNTPLLSFRRVTQAVAPVQVLAKAEWYNPGGSVKDRAALSMILDGERRGLLTSDKTIIDATSGNTGIAYAMIAAERGYRLTVALPKNASEERKQALRAYGAELILTDPHESTDGAQRVAKQLFDENPDKYFYPDQYNNDANWMAHYETTAMEIWRQTDGQVTHFVTGLGTSGTFMGVTRRLKELKPAIQCISMQPDGPLHGLEGLKHMPTALVPGIYDPSIADREIAVATEDAHRMVLRLAREEGLLVGVSSGANLVAANQIAAELKEGVV
ncbi:MAG TPA: cysteine synthase family protein, partial [Tepidisphaeraceae bacterium]